MRRVKIDHFGKIYEIDYDSEEFERAKEAFFKRLDELAKNNDPRVTKGVMGALMNDTCSDLPFPFSCKSLEIRLWPDGKASIAYFCHEVGCLCSPCRDDLMDDFRCESWSCPLLDEIYEPWGDPDILHEDNEIEE